MVFLRDDLGIECLNLKVDIAAVQSVAAELQGISGPDSCHCELLEVCLASQGARLAGVALTQRGSGSHEAHLCIGGGVRDTRVRVPLGTALVIACKLDLPVWLRDGAARPTVPPAFLDAFRSED